MLLSPYRVLDLTNERGLLCGQILADLGADVIAIEPPAGSSARRIGPFRTRSAERGTRSRDDDTFSSALRVPASALEESLFWWAYARNKRSVTIDIESEVGRDELRRLVGTADFLIESFDPGYLDGLGLGYEALAALNPRLVMVSITPFGQSGPKAHWPATDLTVLASSGALLLTGDDDRPPVRVVVPQAFLHAAAEGAVGALIAHAARERDGVGQHVDASAQTAAMMATQSMILQHGWGEHPLRRVSGGVALGPMRLRFVYPCKDGHVSVSFLFGTAIGPFTRRLMELMHEEGFVDAATRDKDWLGYVPLLLSGQEPLSELQRCIDAIERFTLAHTKAELFDAALRRGLLIVPVSTTADAVHSAQLAARDYWQPLAHPDLPAPVTYPGPFAKFSATPIAYRRTAPRLGEHDDAILGKGQEATGNEERPRPSSPLPVTRYPLPLEGVKVLDFTWVMVGPMGVRYLADYGATVVHVESATRVDTARTIQPFKDGQPGPERSGLYCNVNAGKLGLTLNLSTPEVRALALRLATWADVVVESYSPRAMRAWGLDYPALRKVNPSLIMMSTCLNGHSGPHAGLAGFGTMGAALAGFGETAGWPDRPPAGAFGAYTDYVAPKFIASALLAALDHRRRTGEGQYIDLSQAEASIHFLAPAMLDYTVNGHVMSRAGNADPRMAPHGVYPCRTAPPAPQSWGESDSAESRGTIRRNPEESPPSIGGVGGAAPDDRWIALACATEMQWHALCSVAGRVDWRTDPRFATLDARLANRDALDAEVAAWTDTRAVDELEQALIGAGVPAHRVISSADAFVDPQLQFRGHFIEVDHAALGRVPLESSRLRLSRTPAPVPSAPATFGEHNDRVLRNILGLTDDEIVELVTAGALE